MMINFCQPKISSSNVCPLWYGWWSRGRRLLSRGPQLGEGRRASPNNAVVDSRAVGSIFFIWIWSLSKWGRFSSFRLNFRLFPALICTILAMFRPNLHYFVQIFSSDLYQFAQQNLDQQLSDRKYLSISPKLFFLDMKPSRKYICWLISNIYVKSASMIIWKKVICQFIIMKFSVIFG